jgi:hypothetical protein
VILFFCFFVRLVLLNDVGTVGLGVCFNPMKASYYGNKGSLQSPIPVPQLLHRQTVFQSARQSPLDQLGPEMSFRPGFRQLLFPGTPSPRTKRLVILIALKLIALDCFKTEFDHLVIIRKISHTSAHLLLS